MRPQSELKIVEILPDGNKFSSNDIFDFACILGGTPTSYKMCFATSILFQNNKNCPENPQKMHQTSLKYQKNTDTDTAVLAAAIESDTSQTIWQYIQP